MRIGQINQDNYMEFMKLFGGKNSKTVENLTGKNKKVVDERSEDEINAMLVKMGYVEEGMIHKEGDVSWKKIVPVSSEIKDKLIETVRRQFMTNGNGMFEAHDGDEIGALMKKYRASLPASERASATWTLNQIQLDEATRMVDYVKANVPGWQHGQPIPADVLKAAVSGNSLDIQV